MKIMTYENSSTTYKAFEEISIHGIKHTVTPMRIPMQKCTPPKVNAHTAARVAVQDCQLLPHGPKGSIFWPFSNGLATKKW